MPAPIPSGTPSRLAIPRIIPEPTMPLATPPPTSPGGLGVWVRKAQFTEARPRTRRYPKMATNGTRTTITVRIAMPVMAWSVTRRRRLTGDTLCCGAAMLAALDMRARRLAARHRPDQQTCQRVHYDRHQKKRQPNFNQRRQMHVARGLGKLIGQDAGHGISRREKRARNIWTVSDHHGDRHGFPESAPQPQNDTAHDSPARVAQHSDADNLPARRPQCQPCFRLKIGR